MEALEQRALLAIDAVTPATAGAYSPFDTNQDGYISAIDALLIVNQLNNGGAGPLATPAGGSGPTTFSAHAASPLRNTLDVDGDGYLSALDALLVINQLNDETEQLIRIRFETTDLAGNPITEIAAGGSFKLNAYVLDLRASGNDGVFAAFADITFDGALAETSGPIDHGMSYTIGVSGDISSGLLDEVGGIFNSLSFPGPQERFLFSVPFTAGVTPGTLTFVSDPADVLPTHNSLLANIGGAIPSTQITYGTASIEILAGATISVSDASISEGNSGTKQLEFTVSLSQASADQITVDYHTSDLTALAGIDYTAQAGQLIFAPGETSKTVQIDILGDTLNELDDTFNVVLSNPEGASLAAGVGLGTILNDDPEPTISIAAPASITEGDADAVSIFTVTLSAASGKTITVQYATQGGTAGAGSDFIATTGTLTFNPSETSKAIPITIVGDLIDEGTEQFQVVLSAPTNATLTTDTAEATIVDNDPRPTVAVSSPSITEPTVGTATLSFVVTLSKASGQELIFDYGTVNGTAVAGADYAAAVGTLVFEPGETQKTVNVTINADAETEETETFSLVVSNALTPPIASAVGTGTIQDVVTTGKQLRIRLVTTDLEGNPISTVAATDPFLVTAFVEDLREGDDQDGVFQAYLDIIYSSALVNATGPITYGASFPNARAGNVVTAGVIDEAGGAGGEIFPGNPAGEKLLFSVQVVGLAGGVATFTPDPADLSPLHDTLMYGGSSPVALADILFVSADITITPPPGISVGVASVVEGNSGEKFLQVPVTLSEASLKTVSVQYATSALTATPGVDYQEAAGSVTFAPGETSQTIMIRIFGDTLDEDDETIGINLSTPINAVIANGSAVATIVDDDVAPTIFVSDAVAIEGSSDAVFEISLSAVSGRSVTVSYGTANGSATAGSDYQAVTGTITFAPGETLQTVTVPVNYDTLAEPTETFSLVLSAPVNGTLDGNGTGVGSISDLPLSSLAGWVYLDLNQTGIREPGVDIGLTGIPVGLIGVDLFGNPVSAQTVSQSDGSYRFDGLLPGTYTLTQSQPVALLDGIDNLGSLGGTLLNDQFFAIALTVGSHGVEYNFGEAGIDPRFLTDDNFYASSNGKRP